MAERWDDPREDSGCLPQGSLAFTQHYLSDVLQTESRRGSAAGYLGAGRLPEGRPGLFVLWLCFNARQ